jgi:O-antigen ligase/polysaccharide polymerase Wzy-like membrane protein
VSSATSAPWAPPDVGRRRWLFATLLVAGSVVTTGAAVVGNGRIAVAIAPMMAVVVLAAVWLAPLRLSLLTLTFLCLGVDAATEGPWNSPLAPLGLFLTHNLNQTFPVEALTVPAATLALGYFLIIHVHRRLTRARIDAVGRIGFASPMRLALGISLLAVVAECALGYRRGGNIQMAKIQVQDFLLILLMAYLLGMSLRGSRDYRVLGGVILAAACSKSLLALWVSAFHKVPWVPFVTSHGDSILFAVAIVMVIARFAEQPVARNGMLCLATLPLLLSAIVVNNRRIAWVEVAASLCLLYVFSRRTPLKRFLTRSVLAALPVLLLYIAVGWNSHASIFTPIRVFRTVGDSEIDGSTLFRDIENYNLVYTMMRNPIVGAGFGVPFDEHVTTPDISFFREYHFMPHNSVLGLWGFTGLFGFTGLSAALVVGVFLAARSYRLARAPGDRVAAFTALGMILIYMIQCYGDIGFSERLSIFLVGPALAVAGQLALSTGGWGARPATPAVVSGRL